MPQPFSVTSLNLGGTTISTSGGALLVGGQPVSGVGGGGGATQPNGFFQTSPINLRTTGIYPIASGIPSGYMFLIDSLECASLSNVIITGASPSWGIGTGSSFLGSQSIISSNNNPIFGKSGVAFGDRSIFNVPQNGVIGNVFLSVVQSGVTGPAFSGVFILRGALVKYV